MNGDPLTIGTYIVAMKGGKAYKPGDFGVVVDVWNGGENARIQWYGTRHRTWLARHRFRRAAEFEVAVQKKMWYLKRGGRIK